MDDRTAAVHRLAGAVYGEESACGSKIRFGTEATADKAVIATTLKADRKTLEAYPCFWCSKWHIGRAMTPEEYDAFDRLIATYGTINTG